MAQVHKNQQDAPHGFASVWNQYVRDQVAHQHDNVAARADRLPLIIAYHVRHTALGANASEDAQCQSVFEAFRLRLNNRQWDRFASEFPRMVRSSQVVMDVATPEQRQSLLDAATKRLNRPVTDQDVAAMSVVTTAAWSVEPPTSNNRRLLVSGAGTRVSAGTILALTDVGTEGVALLPSERQMVDQLAARNELAPVAEVLTSHIEAGGTQEEYRARLEALPPRIFATKDELLDLNDVAHARVKEAGRGYRRPLGEMHVDVMRAALIQHRREHVAAAIPAASGDTATQVQHILAQWPSSASPLTPELLDTIAERLEVKEARLRAADGSNEKRFVAQRAGRPATSAALMEHLLADQVKAQKPVLSRDEEIAAVRARYFTLATTLDAPMPATAVRDTHDHSL